MVPLCLAAKALAARQAATQASRDALCNVASEETKLQAISRVSASNLAFLPGSPGPCCASGACAVGCTPVQCGAGGACFPVRSPIDDALAVVESAVAKFTCWVAPIYVPTDDGETDISPLLGAGGRDAAATDAFRGRLVHVYHGNECGMCLSSKYCNSDDNTIRALQEVIGLAATKPAHRHRTGLAPTKPAHRHNTRLAPTKPAHRHSTSEAK